MFKRSLIGLVLIGLLAGVTLAADPTGLFLPIYIVKGQISSVSPTTINSHVVQFSSGEVIGSLATPESGAYLLNPYEAQYYGTFPIVLDLGASGTHKISIPTGGDGLGLTALPIALTDMGYTIFNINLGTVITLVEGPVKLNINRVNDAPNSKIRVAWEINTTDYPALLPTNPVDIYYQTGLGSGEYAASGFTNKIIDNNLKAAGAPSGVDFTTGNTYFEWNNQVRAGNPEIYFKACPAGLGSDATYGLSKSVAAGKMDLTITKPYTLISLPFIPTDATGINFSLASIMGDQLVANEEVHRWGNTPADQSYHWATKGTSSWPTTAFTLNHLEGYFIHLNADSASTRLITLVGKVMNAAQTRPIDIKYTTFGLPTPTPKATAAAAGLDDSVQSLPNLDDELHLWDPATQSFKWSTYTGAVTGWKNWATVFGNLTPGRGYFYYRKTGGAPFNWNTIP